jgi:NAD(P)-dependent dehydrogenase (short-subunit alcohol dehydrogenase family)
MSQERFGRKVALVTGAGSGIGRAVAQRFAAEGAKVACLDLGGHAETAAGIGAKAMAIDCDVSDYAAVDAAVAAASNGLGPIDIVCNVAGIGWFANSHEEDPARFAKAIAVNLTGTFHVCRAALPAMVERKAGIIVNTASTAGMMGQPWSAAYCASKGGVVLMTKALAFEYREIGIRINAVAPGGTKTNIVGGFSPPPGADWKKMTKMMSEFPMAEPEEMANVFAFIASDEARFMTGSLVAMDGGITA